MPADYIYPGSVWANSSPDKVWLLLGPRGGPLREWPIPPVFEVNKDYVEWRPPFHTTQPTPLYNKVNIRMASSNDQGWLTGEQALWLLRNMFVPLTLHTNLLRGNYLPDGTPAPDDGFSQGLNVFIVPPIRVWPVDWGGQYYQYEVNLVTEPYKVQ